MFGKPFDLFTILGFRIRIDASWLLLALLVTSSLATGVFPVWQPGLSVVACWAMGAVGAVGLFFSIVVHELAHSVVARRHGVDMRGITLFIFGGVAEMTGEPPNARAELRIAVAGPLTSVFVSGFSFLAGLVATRLGAPYPIIGVSNYLGIINGALVLFNLVPAFPLDGGRVLRSVLWNWKKDLMWSTFVASRIGIGFSFVLMGWGAWSVYQGNPIGGIWYVLIGLFLRGAAIMSYRQVLSRGTFQRENVRKFMRGDPVTAPADISIDAFVREYLYRYHFRMFPVMDGDRLIGCVRTRELKEIPRESWAAYRVRDISVPVSQDNSVSPDSSAAAALAKMNQSGSTRLLVLDGGGLVGVITLKDLLHHLSLRSEFQH